MQERGRPFLLQSKSGRLVAVASLGCESKRSQQLELVPAGLLTHDLAVPLLHDDDPGKLTVLPVAATTLSGAFAESFLTDGPASAG